MGAVVMIIGAVLCGFAFISGIGFGLYEWGSQGIPFGHAAWAGFKVWAEMMGGGLGLIIVGPIAQALTSKRVPPL